MAPQLEQWRAAAYLIVNLVSGTGIVFANKLVLSILGFHYVRLPAYASGSSLAPIGAGQRFHFGDWYLWCALY